MTDNSTPLVFKGDGATYNLREFVDLLRKADGQKPVTQICKDAGISRANYYFLIGSSATPSVQVPTLETLVALLTALGATGIDIPAAPDQPIVVETKVGRYTLASSAESLNMSRGRMLVRAAGVAGVAATVASGVAQASRGSKLTTSALGPAIPLALEILARALRATENLSDLAIDKIVLPSAAGSEVVDIPPLDDVLAEISTDEIEHMIATLKAERESRSPEHAQ